MYDLIGDIHGHANELTQLLEALGYRKHGSTYSHPERKVIFLGDFIDRGPKIREVLEIVHPMVEEGNALARHGRCRIFGCHRPHRALSDSTAGGQRDRRGGEQGAARQREGWSGHDGTITRERSCDLHVVFN